MDLSERFLAAEKAVDAHIAEIQAARQEVESALARLEALVVSQCHSPAPKKLVPKNSVPGENTPGPAPERPGGFARDEREDVCEFPLREEIPGSRPTEILLPKLQARGLGSKAAPTPRCWENPNTNKRTPSGRHGG
jgi:hypothetical protein